MRHGSVQLGVDKNVSACMIQNLGIFFGFNKNFNFLYSCCWLLKTPKIRER